MATSGVRNFSMDIDEVIEEALEMVGGEATLGNEPRSARRSINLLLNDWQNRGIPLWSIDTTAIDFTDSIGSFNLSSDTLDVLEAVHHTSATDSDIVMTRISMQEYLQIPNKNQTGRPIQYAVRAANGDNSPTVYLWPVPDNSTDSIKFEQVKYLEDVTKSAGQTADIAQRFYPALPAGVAYFMSLKRDNVPEPKIARLKAEYEERLDRALVEDRERVNMFIKPKLS